ncbi:hypothetical protein [Ralstonia solanacearum]|uniref:hypothetical protein n=1 Tax=Ralstonia solanacearum TaxID=305 RepID=UPI0001D95517|nr:hypothetical protein [Ralstonia solanacearum]CBJ50981.1 hypothethical protein [Ralstonia solanacearum PSI07]
MSTYKAMPAKCDIRYAFGDDKDEVLAVFASARHAIAVANRNDVDSPDEIYRALLAVLDGLLAVLVVQEATVLECASWATEVERVLSQMLKGEHAPMFTESVRAVLEMLAGANVLPGCYSRR